jgi:hypothetical protein
MYVALTIVSAWGAINDILQLVAKQSLHYPVHTLFSEYFLIRFAIGGIGYAIIINLMGIFMTCFLLVIRIIENHNNKFIFRRKDITLILLNVLLYVPASAITFGFFLVFIFCGICLSILAIHAVNGMGIILQFLAKPFLAT